MTQKSLTPLLAASLAALALAGAGCSSTAGKNPQFADQDRNFMGIIKIEPGSFADTSPSTLLIRSNDIIEQPNISGDKVSLFSGLFTYEDY
jgi:hypothetical protein